MTIRVSIAQSLLALIFLSPIAQAQGSSGSSVVVVSPSRLVSSSIAVISKMREVVPSGSRLVIGRIEGSTGYGRSDCGAAVRDALVRRLIDNTGYSVLSRDDLELILFEGDQAWGGRFNSQTAPMLGELVAAGFFIVGRVSYCGLSASDSPENRAGIQFSMLVNLQVIDSKTAEVMFASSSEGSYFPAAEQLRFAGRDAEASRLEEEEAGTGKSGMAKRLTAGAKIAGKVAGEVVGGALGRRGRVGLRGTAGVGASSAVEAEEQGDEKGGGQQNDEEKLWLVRAADDVASRFADKFLGRPLWEPIEVWHSPQWRYSDSVRHIQLGDCPQAIAVLEGAALLELGQMVPEEIAEYLHNYGVALLCTDQVDRAMTKLRSAYRISANPATLRMLGLAAKIEEWSLTVEIDQEPEIKRLRDRVGDLY